jgi:hypothetical protein
VANILTHPAPRLADVQCSRLRFEPGDRVLVRVRTPITNEQERKLRRSVARWAGIDDDCVMVINALEMSINVQPTPKIVP